MKDAIADPKAGVAIVKARDGIINEELELRRLKLCLDATVLTPDAKAEGFGNAMAPRLSLMASQVSDAFATKERVNPNAVWNGSLLPSAAERDIFASPRRICEQAWEHRWTILGHAWRTYWITMVGFAIAVAVGVLLGFLMGSSRLAYSAMYPLTTGSTRCPRRPSCRSSSSGSASVPGRRS